MLIPQRFLSVMLVFVLLVSLTAPAQNLQAQQPASPRSASAAASAEPASIPASPEVTVTPPVSPAKVLLKVDTEVPLKFAQSVHSRLSKPGATIELVLAEDLKVGNLVVVRKGARSLGSVTRTNNPNSLGKGGELYLQVEFLKVGRSLIKLRGEGGGKQGRHVCWQCGVGGAVVLGGVGAIVMILGSGGKQYVIKEGTQITGYVAEDIELPVLPE